MDRAVGEIHVVVKVIGSLQEALWEVAAVTSGIDVIAAQTGLWPSTRPSGRSPDRLLNPEPARLQKVTP